MLVLIMRVLPCYLATPEVRRLPRPPATATPRASHILYACPMMRTLPALDRTVR